MAQQRWELEQLSQRLGASRVAESPMPQPDIETQTSTHHDVRKPAPELPAWMAQRVSFLSSHLNQQNDAFHAAQKKTQQLFNELLDSLELMADSFRTALRQPNQPTPNVHAIIDPDRSVGVLTLLWHNISFTVCDQYQPLAVERLGKPPLMACRIMATLGDYRHQHSLWETADTQTAPHEFASLFVPSPEPPSAPTGIAPLMTEQCLLRFAHTTVDRTLPWDQVVPVFLSSVLDALCGGGHLHTSPNNGLV